jgi:hypothetical protein
MPHSSSEVAASPVEHRINYGRLYPGKSYKADCTCGWTCDGSRDEVTAAVRRHEDQRPEPHAAVNPAALVQEAIQAWPQFDTPHDQVSGADLVEWFCAWRERAKALQLPASAEHAALRLFYVTPSADVGGAHAEAGVMAASPEEALAVVAAELGLALTFQEQEDGSPGDDWFVRQIPDALPSTRGMVTDHFAFSFWRVKE